MAILYNDRELPSDAVINFLPEGEAVLSLRCLASGGNGGLVWDTRDVSAPTYSTVYGDNSPDMREVFLSSLTGGGGKSGYYTCTSTESAYAAEVYFTSENPLWEVISERNVSLPIGASFTIEIYYGDFADGVMNIGSGFGYTITFQPCVDPGEEEGGGGGGGGGVVVATGSTPQSGFTLLFSFMASPLSAGTYEIEGTCIRPHQLD